MEQKLEPELKSRWCEALRSGKFNQGVMNLKADRGTFKEHCCLGVLLEIEGYYSKDHPTNTGYVELEKYMDIVTMEKLWTRNDGVQDFSGNRMNFEEIADFIEKEL